MTDVRFPIKWLPNYTISHFTAQECWSSLRYPVSWCFVFLTITGAAATSVRHIVLLLLLLLPKYSVLHVHSDAVAIFITIITIMSDIKAYRGLRDKGPMYLPIIVDIVKRMSPVSCWE
jgi:uncharacterized membrane protein